MPQTWGYLTSANSPVSYPPTSDYLAIKITISLLLAFISAVFWSMPTLQLMLKSPSSFFISLLLKKKMQERASIKESHGTDCPYEYILRVYGKNHFSGMVNIIDPGLKEADPVKWQIVMEAMDCVHFAAILVDDVTDNSPLRKGQPAAHTIYGPLETVNRAYTRLFEIIAKASAQRPSLVPILIQNLVEIHQGQDMSLVWRRDRGTAVPKQREECLAAYRHSASLKTGALFRMLGQLVMEDGSKDELMTRVGWYCQLQNDCKNVYSSSYVVNKGSICEDIQDGEYSYPILLALHGRHAAAVDTAIETRGKIGLKQALAAIQHREVREACLGELDAIADTIPEFVDLWGRREKMDVGQGTMK